jgi:PAS domain S-box-containing protein
VTTKGDENELLRSVALQNANSILIARQRAERRSEAYLAEAQRLSHTGSFGWRPSTGEIIWSEETFRIFQCDRATTPTVELILQRAHPEDAAMVKQTIESASQDEKDFDLEHRLLMPGGSVKHVHVVAHALSDESGGMEFVGAVMDVTIPKQAEGGIRQIINTIPAYAWSTEPDGSVDFINQRFVEFTGRSIEELRGWGWASTHHPDDLAREVAVWRAALAAGEPMESEVRVRGRDGDYRWLLIRNVPLRDELGNIVKWYGTAIEIEDRKRAEVLLAGEKRLLEMIARGDSRAPILDAICRLVEELASGSLSSILLLDPSANSLRHGAAPSLPTAYTEAIDGVVIGPFAGSCGTAAYRAEPVIVSDIATDPLWADYRDLALAHGLRACWSTPILSSAGEVLGTFATYYRESRSPTAQDHSVITQITHLATIAVERKQAEQKLRQSEAYLQEAQRLGHSGSWARNLSSQAFFASPELLRIFGHDPDEEKPTWEMFRERIHPEDLPPVEQRAIKAISEKANLESNYRIVLPDGSIRHVHSVAHPILDDAVEVVEYIGTIMDVTERKQADEERERLLASERSAFAEAVAAQQRFRDLVNSVEGIVWEADLPSFQFLFISKQAERVLGYPVERWLSEPTFWKDHVHPEDREWALQFCQSATAEKRDHDFEYRMIAADGSVVFLRDLVTVVVENNHATRLRGVMVDIGKRKQAEETLRQALADLAHVSRVTTMGELTASLAHEINQPITGIVTNGNACVRWLAGDAPNLKEAREAASRIVRDGQRAGDVIARIRALVTKTATAKIRLDMNQTIQEIIALARDEVRRKSVTLRMELANDLWPVLGDRVQLQQVLLNLVMNGVEAMSTVEERSRKLVIRTQNDEADQVRVTVQDSGIGLAPQSMERIFNAFYTTKHGGMGMGLSISRSIVQNHGGRLWAVANDGPGTTFQFTVPKYH